MCVERMLCRYFVCTYIARATYALAIPDRLSPSGPKSPIDTPSSRSSLINGTLSLAGKLLKLMTTFAFAKRGACQREPHKRGRGGKAGIERGSRRGEVHSTFTIRVSTVVGLWHSDCLFSFQDVEHRSIGTSEDWIRCNGAHWKKRGVRMGRTRSMRCDRNMANAQQACMPWDRIMFDLWPYHAMYIVLLLRKLAAK